MGTVLYCPLDHLASDFWAEAASVMNGKMLHAKTNHSKPFIFGATLEHWRKGRAETKWCSICPEKRGVNPFTANSSTLKQSHEQICN